MPCVSVLVLVELVEVDGVGLIIDGMDREGESAGLLAEAHRGLVEEGEQLAAVAGVRRQLCKGQPSASPAPFGDLLTPSVTAEASRQPERPRAHVFASDVSKVVRHADPRGADDSR